MLLGTIVGISAFFPATFIVPSLLCLTSTTEEFNNSVGVVLPEEPEDDLWLETEAPALGERNIKGDTLSLLIPEDNY